MKTELKYWCAAVISIALFSGFSLLLGGCATTGSVPADIITKSAAVDTAISQLQTQQAESAGTAQVIRSTTENLKQTAEKINNPELTEQVDKLDVQTKTLIENQKAERNKTAQVQTDYTEVKTTAGKVLTDQSGQINKLSAQLKVSLKWNWRLGITLACVSILIIIYTVAKIRS
jgi:hypothetical protein